MAQKIKQFFMNAEEVFDAFPGYVKVFLYSTISAIAGMYITRQPISVDAVIGIVLVNLGLYKGKTTITKMRLR